MIVGVTGKDCSGKDTAAEYLQLKGFEHISLSDFLRAELQSRRKEITRENLIAMGNELRQKYGHGVLAMHALEAMNQDKKYVVSSIRNPVEVEVLQKRKNFILINIEAPIKIRYQRMMMRKRHGDSKSFEEFVEKEKKEQGSDPAGQQLHKVAALAEVIILNTENVEQFHAKLDKFLHKYGPRLNKRPSWDEYFLKLASTVGSRATCDRGKAGAIIVKNKRLLSTGYVGAPVGLPHCDEEGHELQTVTNDDSTQSKHCIRTTHAEQNAIVQAARYGISIDGATIYCKLEPCYVCAKMIVNAGIKRVVCENRYHRAQRTREIFKKAGVALIAFSEETVKYANQK